MSDTKTASKEATITKSQEKQLQKLSPYESQVKTLVAELRDLKIHGVDDRDGLKAAHKGRMALKDLRVQIDKERKALIEPALQWQRTVNAKAKEMTEQIKPIEKRLKDEEDRIKEEKRKIKEAKERERMQKLRIRTTWITQHGGSWDIVDASEDPTISAYGQTFTQEELMDMDEDGWQEVKVDISHRFAQAKIKQEVEQIIDKLKAKGMVMVVPEGDEADNKPHLYLDYYAGEARVYIDEIETAVKVNNDQMSPERILGEIDAALKARQEYLDQKAKADTEAMKRQQEEIDKAKERISIQRRELLAVYEDLLTKEEREVDPGKMSDKDFDTLLENLKSRKKEDQVNRREAQKILQKEEPINKTKGDNIEVSMDQEDTDKKEGSALPLLVRASTICAKILKSPFLAKNLPEVKKLKDDIDRFIHY